jgi:hypothetical protein
MDIELEGDLHKFNFIIIDKLCNFTLVQGLLNYNKREYKGVVITLSKRGKVK